MKCVFLLDKNNFERIYSKEVINKISDKIEIIGRFESVDEIPEGSDINIVFSGWGGVPINKKAIDKMPNLKLVLYGAGTIKKIQSEEMRDKGIRISSASQANAIPVAQYTTSLIQLLLKDFFRLSKISKNIRNNKLDVYNLNKGFYNRNIGIISYSNIGKRVIENIQKLSNNNIFVYDPYYSEEYLKEKGLIKSTLQDIFSNCDVVSLHSPLIKETEYMIGYEHFSSMKENASFINTARGKIIKTDELIRAFTERKDLMAILDVTDPEPLEDNSPLYDMDNIILSPHIAGSLGNETYLMGESMYDELIRFLNGEELEYEITKEKFKRMA